MLTWPNLNLAKSMECAEKPYEYIAKCIELANKGKVDAVATTPINKESLRAGGINYIGHTEIFRRSQKQKDPAYNVRRQMECVCSS